MPLFMTLTHRLNSSHNFIFYVNIYKGVAEMKTLYFGTSTLGATVAQSIHFHSTAHCNAPIFYRDLKKPVFVVYIPFSCLLFFLS